MVSTTGQFCQMWWREVCKKVKKSVVFLDDKSAECLHWGGGMMQLILAGAVSVKEFSSFESGQVSNKKAVFITSSPIINQSEVILRDIIKNSQFEYCILISAAHPTVQQIARGGDSDMAALQNLEDDMLQWMGNMNYTVEIFYMPLFLAPITDCLFVTPGFRNLFPDISGINEDNEILINQFVNCLHSWFTQLNVQESVFSLGSLSGQVASYLEELPAAINRRKSAVNKVSLILIDRTLDLMTVLKHNSDSVLDRIISVLPHLPGHTNDIAVNMSLVSNAKIVSVLDDVFLAPGCLSQPNGETSKVMEWLIGKKQRELLMGLNQHLSQLSSDVRSDKVANRVTPYSLEKQIAALRGNSNFILNNNGVIQQALSVTQTLKSSRYAELDLLANLESLQEHQGASALTQIIQLIRTRHERKISLEDILCLLMHLYSSNSDISFSEAEENELELLIGESLLEDRESLTNGILQKVNKYIEESTLSEFAKQICEKIQNLPSARYEFLREGNGLVQQLIGDLFDPSRPAIPELSSKSPALTDILKTGFSLLMNKSTSKHPLDNSQLILFIIGGITGREVKVIQDLVSNSGLAKDLLIGGTRLLTPRDVMETVLLDD